MNSQIMMASVAAAFSVGFIGFLVYRLGSRSNNTRTMLDALPQNDNSSLEEDLNDILAFVPLIDVQNIIEQYMKYDSQIGDTVSFITDQKRFVLRQLRNMPQMIRLIDFLKQNGLDTDYWNDKVRVFWKTAPRFVGCEPNIADGGLTVMISNILRTIPLDELHELLRQKLKYSSSFRRFIKMLRSKEFVELCCAIEENDVLHHHFFWAKEGGLEITFAIELLKDLHHYLTDTLILPLN